MGPVCRRRGCRSRTRASRRRRFAQAIPGVGGRAGDPVEPVAVLPGTGQIGAVQPVIHPDDAALYEAAAEGLRLLAPGDGRRDAAGIGAGRPGGAGARAPDIVLVHDAARPFCSAELIVARDRGLRRNRRGDPGAARSPTRSSASMRTARVAGTLDRAPLRAVQTPQAFAFRRAARRAPPRRAQKAATISPTTRRSPNGRASRSRRSRETAGNVKLTTDEDFAKAEARRDREPRRSADRQRLRRARLRRRRSRLARRRQDPARRAG